MYKDNLHDTEVVRNLSSEIKRYTVINYLIEKHKLVNYLEIGVFTGENIREVKALHKDGVDPGVEGYTAPEVNYPMTSDRFFELIEGHDDIKYDLIFIDGLHHADQVQKDIQNSLKHIVDGGFILLHDCNPPSYEAQLVPRQTVAWTGDVWKAFVAFKANNPNFKCCVIDTDFGIGVIHINTNHKPIIKSNTLNWNDFSVNRKLHSNLITWNEFKTTY